PLRGFGEIYRNIADEFTAPGITYDDPSDAKLTIRQVLYLTGKFSSIMPKLLASMGGAAGVNHATHDVLPDGAGVPWSLLGDTFVESCEALETTEGSDTIAVRIAKPTKLKDILIPELALRFAFLVWKDGGYRVVSPPTPNATT